MENSSSPLYVFNTHVEAEQAIQALSRSGFDVKKTLTDREGLSHGGASTGFLLDRRPDQELGRYRSFLGWNLGFADRAGGVFSARNRRRCNGGPDRGSVSRRA